MKNLALISTLSLFLASCSMVAPTNADYTLARQTTVTTTDPVYAPAGTAKIGHNFGVTRTSVTLTGMAPYAIYVGHYHKQGKADVPACESGGEAIMESKVVAQADKDGKVTLNSYIPSATIKDATYFNVHTARDLTGTPADSGVICTPVTVP